MIRQKRAAAIRASQLGTHGDDNYENGERASSSTNRDRDSLPAGRHALVEMLHRRKRLRLSRNDNANISEIASSSSLDETVSSFTPADRFRRASSRVRQRPITRHSSSSRLTATTAAMFSVDILFEVSRHLGSRDLNTCRYTCRSWKEAIDQSSALWDKVELSGSFQQMNRQWEYIRAKHNVDNIDEIDIYSLTIHHDERNAYAREEIIKGQWEDGVILRTFPFPNLKELNYYGVSKKIDALFFDLLKESEGLRVLKFRSRENPHTKWAGSSDTYQLATLDNCKLETLEVDADFEIRIDQCNYERMKRLVVKQVMDEQEMLICIMNAAATLQELRIGAVDHRAEDDWDEERPRDRPYNHDDESLLLPRLTSFEAIHDDHLHPWGNHLFEQAYQGMSRVWYNLQAPHLTNLTYKHFLGWDDKLFSSCSGHLRVVDIEVNNHNLKQVYSALESLHRCEDLTIRMAVDHRHSWPNPWKGKDESGKNPHNLCLGNLRSLTITNDVVIDGKELMDLIKHKKEDQDHVKLESLTLHDCYRIEGETVGGLRAAVPRFNFTLSR